MSVYQYSKSLDLFKRAAKVIPGGIYGHMSPAITVPGAFPYYAARGEGSHYWDVDGNEFIDYMCGYGPMVLGYKHPVVDAAVTEQMQYGDCFNHPTELSVKLAERLTGLVPIADWCVFGKNGGDMTTWATQVAREYTARPKILMAKGAYHGIHAWCTPGHGGLIEEDRTQIHQFVFNDLDSVYKLVEEHKGKIATIITTPYHHPAFGDSVMPKPDWYPGLRKVCDAEGIVLIVDDVRAGFRMNIGGSNEYFKVKADMLCFSKALGNCYPISATVGNVKYKEAAARVFCTGSFWNTGMPMAASLATLDVLEKEKGVEKMLAFGTKLMKGLEDLAKSNGLQVTVSGPPSIPFMRFTNETNFYRQQLFCAEATKRGIFLHPHHNWFVCTAHTDEDLKKTFEVADIAYKIVKKEFGN